MDHAARRESARDSVRHAAAQWHARLNIDKVSPETIAAFEQWTRESPEHQSAYDEVAHAWTQMKSVAHEPQILALRHEAALRLTRRSNKNTRTLQWAVAASIALIVGVAATLLTAGLVGQNSAILALLGHTDGRYLTATGERLTLSLNDGSQLTLNTQTDLTVAFTKSERIVHLTRGQAIFEVAKDPKRPFVVEARDRRFVAVGTAFDVRFDGDQVNVTMIEGTVRVESAGLTSNRLTEAPSPTSSRARERTLVNTITAGEQLTIDRQNRDRVRPANAERVTSWRHGQVIFDNTRLIDAIAELNRYSAAQIELSDPQLAELRLSGGFNTARPAVFVEAITSYFPIEIERATEDAVILRARGN